MAFTYTGNRALTNVPNNINTNDGFAFLLFDINQGFKLVVPEINDYVTYFRDIDDTGDADGVENTASATVVLQQNKARKISGTIPENANIVKIGSDFYNIQNYISKDTIALDRVVSRIIVTGVTEASPAVLTTEDDHGLSVDDPVRITSIFDTGTTPYPLGDGGADSGIFPDVTYYVGTVPTTTTFTLSSTTSNANPIEVTSAGNSSLQVLPVLSLFKLKFDADSIEDTIIGKVNKNSTVYEFEPFFVSKNIDNRIGESANTASTLDKDDANDAVIATGNITVPSGEFSPRDVVIIMGGGTARTITRGSGLAMYFGGTDSASVTLNANGIMSVTFETASKCYVSGDIT